MFQQPLEQQYLQRHIYWCWGYKLCKEQWICIHRFLPLHIVFGNLRVGNLTQLYDYHKRKTFRPNFGGFPGGLNGKESACNEGDLGLIPGIGRPWLPIPVFLGLPWWLRWWICLQCGRPGFTPWVRKIPWRREWLPTPVFLLGEFHELRSLVGCSLWGREE